MNGYLIKVTRPNMNAIGGQETTKWLAIAVSAEHALSLIAAGSSQIVDSGPHVLVQARAAGVEDGGAKQV